MGRPIDDLIIGLRLVPTASFETPRDAAKLHKFGANIDADVGVEDIWDGGGNGNANALYDYPAAAETLYFSSDDAGDDADMEALGLDADWASQSVDFTLAGQTKTALTGSWQRTFRVRKQATASDFAGTVYIYADDTVVGGVPQTPAKIRAIVTPTYQQTMMALYTVPAGNTLVMPAAYASMARGTGAAAAEITLQARPFGGSFRTQDAWGVHSYGSPPTKSYDPPRVFAEKTDVRLTCNSVAVNGVVHGGFHGYVVPGAWS